MRLVFVCLLATSGFLFAEEPKKVVGHVFAWPFLEVEKMQPRGGMTKGTEVVLDGEVSEEWKRLQMDVKSKYAKDKHAILAMAGSYRVSFDFVETMGFEVGYKPRRPYFSWGTEHVEVIEVGVGFVSLQHTLVMFFKGKDGKESGPMVMKHWRQDWRYEDRDLHVYRGKRTWERERKDVAEVAGKWTQAVFQVDDSPRYEVVGEWSHEGGMSVWKSDSSWRPLPRREFSVRDDYNVLQGTHEITLTPTGWVHVQNNQKLSLGDEGNRFVGQELGVNRYERIVKPSLVAAAERLRNTGGRCGRFGGRCMEKTRSLH